jgi:hypothetical protein
MVLAVEAGITLGALGLHLPSYEGLRSTGPTWSVRIDDHPELDGWTTTRPDGSTEETTFAIPVKPVLVPEAVLAGDSAFSDWVWSTHGALGRLLLWDAASTWWIVNEPDLESTLLCAQPAQLSALLPGENLDSLARQAFAGWIPTLTDTGREKATEVATRFGLIPPGPN